MKLGAVELEVYSNSRLVVSQVEGIFEAGDPRMVEYLKLVLLLQASLGSERYLIFQEGVTVMQIPWPL